MKAELTSVIGYQGDHMNLPVASVDAAIPFYETVLGFHVRSRTETPQRSATLERDGIQMRVAENGGDSAQDGCAFHVNDVESLFAEFKSNGLNKEQASFETERHGDASWKVFYVVAPPEGGPYVPAAR
jgi:lactoylglutathione lyase